MSEADTGFVVVNRRRLPFAPQTVFDAFAQPEQLAQWWGPDGFSNRIDAFDFRPGGVFRITMTNENGRSFDNDKRFVEIDAPRLIVIHHLQPMHDFTLSMSFDEVEGHTDLTWHMDFVPGSNADLADFLHAANEQNFDRLEAFLKA